MKDKTEKEKEKKETWEVSESLRLRDVIDGVKRDVT